MSTRAEVSRRSQLSTPGSRSGLTRLKAENDALMDRLGPLMRTMRGASAELVAVRRRARALERENAQLREDNEHLRSRIDDPQSSPADPQSSPAGPPERSRVGYGRGRHRRGAQVR